MEEAYNKLQDEFEQNLVYLLIKRYKMSYGVLCKAFKVTQTQMRSYYQKHKDVINSIIDSEVKDAIGMADGVPTIESLKAMALQRIAKTLPGEDDPSRIARTYEVLCKADQSGEKANKRTMSEAIMSKLSKNNKEEENAE